MMKKTIGYVLALLGLAGIAFSSFSKTPLLPDVALLTNKVFIIISIALIAVGAFLAIERKTRQKTREVPIYEGKNIVGYRREK